jgi:hypothetical protein
MSQTATEPDNAIVGGDYLAQQRMFREAARAARLDHDEPKALRYERAARLAGEIARTLRGED